MVYSYKETKIKQDMGISQKLIDAFLKVYYSILFSKWSWNEKMQKDGRRGHVLKSCFMI